MKKFKLDDILSKVAIPLVTYLVIGLFVLELTDIEKMNTFLVWSVLSGVIYAVKDVVQNKIVTLGMWIYVLGVAAWFILGMKEQGSNQAVIMLVSIVAIAFLRFLQKYPIVYIVAGYSSIIVLVVLTIRNYEFSKLLVVFVVFLLLYAISETLAMREKRKLNNKSLILVYGIVAIVTFWSPVSEEPYGWEFVENITNAIQETLRNFVLEVDYQWGKSNHDVFRVSFSGYSDEQNSLTTSIKDSDSPQLDLEGRRTKRNLYLKGNVTNCFTGDKWKNTLASGTMDITTDTLMTMYAIYSYYNQKNTDNLQEDRNSDMIHVQNSDAIRRFVDAFEYKITLRNIKTRSLFYPVKSTDISAENQKMEGDNLQSKSINERGYSYNIKFLDMDYANPVLIDIIQKSEDIVYDKTLYNELYENMELYFDVEIDKIPFDKFVEDVANADTTMEAGYAIVDETVSESVYELANTIVQNCENDYQKCKALENFLSQYQYNKIISIPEDANVLDWFLFGGREGYCTHFATALVEMLRSVGIPARMVEGFLVDFAYSERSDSYVITAQNAHAWTEAYIDGFGWIKLDATASDKSENTVWYPDDSYSEVPNYNQPSWNETLLEEQLEELRREEEQRLEEELIRKEEEKNNWMLVGMLISGMAGVILFLGIILLIYRKVMVQRSKNPNIIFDDIMKLLKRKCREKANGETLKEYFRSIEKEYDFSDEISIEFHKLILILEQYWYGEIVPNDKEIESMQKIRSELKKEFQEHTKKESIIKFLRK